MVSNDTVEEYYQFREAMRPFLEREMGLNSRCDEQRALEAIEQLIDFEDHMSTNDPEMLNTCAEMIFVSKALLQKYVTKKYLDDADLEKLEKKLKI